MTKTALVDSVLAGKEVERPPISFWYHFGIQFRGPAPIADTALAFFRHYDLGWLKVMNDFYYPLPEGLSEVASAKDLAGVKEADVGRTDWAVQLEALEIIARDLEGQAYFIDTVFDPWQQLARSVAGHELLRLSVEAPDALTDALDAITATLISYCRKSIAAGAHGIFLSTLASHELVPRDTWLRFAKPYAVRLLSAIQDAAPMNVAHIHGSRIFIDDVLDFPVPVLSYEDRLASNPAASEVKARWSGAVMCGIDRTLFARATPAAAARHIHEALALGGRSRFFLSGGCSLSPEYSPRVLSAAVAACRGGF